MLNLQINEAKIFVNVAQTIFDIYHCSITQFLVCKGKKYCRENMCSTDNSATFIYNLLIAILFR